MSIQSQITRLTGEVNRFEALNDLLETAINSLPEAGSGGSSGGGSDTLTWNGNTTGLDSIQDQLFKISNVVPEAQYLLGEVTITLSDGQVIKDTLYPSSENGTFTDGDFNLMILAEADVEALGMPGASAGVWFSKNPENGNYTSSLTIPGYAGFVGGDSGGGGSVETCSVTVNFTGMFVGYGEAHASWLTYTKATANGITQEHLLLTSDSTTVTDVLLGSSVCFTMNDALIASITCNNAALIFVTNYTKCFQPSAATTTITVS